MKVLFQDTGLSPRKRHRTGYTEQLQQYSSPGEASGRVGVGLGGYTDRELEAPARDTPGKSGFPQS